MEVLIFGHGGKAVLFFPPRMGRFYDYENWGIVDALRDRINKGELQLFCVDSIDTETFYNNWAHPHGRITRHQQYEQYIINEVVPLMHSKNKGGYYAVAGCSLGAYHAANLALRHSHLFSKVVCMSGRFDLTRQVQFFNDLLDGYHNEDVYFNMPRQYMANLYDETNLNTIRNMEIILAIGEADPFIYDNREFSGVLWNKQIGHQFYVWGDYAHKPRYWRQMVGFYL
jgi:esterase/lipase superfamily enzyme